MRERFVINVALDVLWWIDETTADPIVYEDFSLAKGWILTREPIYGSKSLAIFYFNQSFGNQWGPDHWEPLNLRLPARANNRLLDRVRVEVMLLHAPEGGTRIVQTDPPLDLPEMAMLDAMVARMMDLIGDSDA